jgi:sarcosine oxidase subunit beta
MTNNYDAVIIGAGVIGAAIAFEMSKAGKKTLNVDMLPAAGYGSTSNSCAIIRVYYSTLDGSALANEGYYRWKDWANYLGVEDEKGLVRFHDTGCLVMKTDHNDQLTRVTAIMDQLDIPYEHWDAAKVSERLPILDLKKFEPAKLPEDEGFGEPTGGDLTGGVFFPHGGYINDPQLSAHNLQRAAEAHGATFVFGKRVSEIPQSNGRVTGVVLEDGTAFDAPVVINVAGPHSNIVNEMAGAADDMKITTKALRQEVVHVPSPVGFDFERDGMVISDSDISCYARPEIGNHILVGSEDPACDEYQVVDPDTFDRNFTEQWRTQALRQAQRVPGLGIPSQMKGVVDLYDVTEDWIPIYDRSSVDGYYMAIGTSGNQFKNAPVVGAMMNELVDYVEGGADHDASPMAFHLTVMDRTIDLATFSRLREINADSSFSVLG